VRRSSARVRVGASTTAPLDDEDLVKRIVTLRSVFAIPCSRASVAITIGRTASTTRIRRRQGMHGVRVR
jgi:hypothetical protein